MRTAGYSRTSDVDEQFMSVLQSKFIVIDDLGQENHLREKDMIGRLLWEAFDMKKQLIITSNLSGEELVQRYGQAFMSRMQATGNAVWIGIKGKDLR